MNRTSLSSSVGPVGRTWAVLVLAVLAGLLAMHGLAPGGAPSMGEHAGMAASSSSDTGPAAHAAPAPHCAGAGPNAVSTGAGGGMRMDHADGMCTADGVSTAYAPPALAPALTIPAPAAAAVPGKGKTGAVDGRAPPDLAQLQLLRI